METLNFVSEQALLASGRISKKTLDRYTEAGHLRVYINAEGSRRYRLEDLQSLFGLTDLAPDETKETVTPNQRAEGFPSWGIPRSSQTVAMDEPNATVTPPAQPATASQPETSPAAPAALDSGALLEALTGSRKVEVDDSARATAAEPSTAPVASVDAPSTEAAPTSSGMQISSDIQAAAQAHEQEVARLLRLLEHQESLLAERDSRVKELIEERRWLRDRVEKLEEQLARTQVLMLSGNQTIQDLVSQRRPGPSTLQRALAWLGFAQLPPPAETDSREIENSSTASNPEETDHIRVATHSKETLTARRGGDHRDEARRRSVSRAAND